jgi:hypothetical protein
MFVVLGMLLGTRSESMRQVCLRQDTSGKFFVFRKVKKFKIAGRWS